MEILLTNYLKEVTRKKLHTRLCFHGKLKKKHDIIIKFCSFMPFICFRSF